MKQLLDIAKKLLYPGWKWTLVLVAAGGAGLYLVFSRGLEESPLAYGVYLLSFYALVAVVGLATRVCPPVWRRISSVPLVARWQSDDYFRVRMSLAASCWIDLFYAVFRVVCAVFCSSFWDGALGFYYALLCAVRFYLLRRTPGSRERKDYRRELRACRWAGVYLLALNLALLWISVQIVQFGRGYHYPGTLIYAMAAYAFYSLTVAIINAVKYRKFHSPVLTAAKSVNLTCALVSIFSLETAMLSQFGGDAQFQLLMTSATAAAVCILVLLIAIFLVASVNRKLWELS